MPFEKTISVAKRYTPDMLARGAFTEDKPFQPGWKVLVVQSANENDRNGEVSWILRCADAEELAHTSSFWLTFSGSRRKQGYYNQKFNELIAIANGCGLATVREVKDLIGGVFIAKLVENRYTPKLPDENGEIKERVTVRLGATCTPDELAEYGELKAAERNRLKRLHTATLKKVDKGEIAVQAEGEAQSIVPEFRGATASEAGIDFTNGEA